MSKLNTDDDYWEVHYCLLYPILREGFGSPHSKGVVRTPFRMGPHRLMESGLWLDQDLKYHPHCEEAYWIPPHAISFVKDISKYGA